MKRLLMFVFAIMPLLAFATDEICQPGYYPAEYIELEYIESTGTQYIDTLYKPNNKTKIYLDIQLLQSSGSYPALFGCRTSNHSQDTFFSCKDGNRIRIEIGSSKMAFFNYSYANKYNIECNYAYVKVNGVKYSTGQTSYSQSRLNLYLFGLNENGHLDTGFGSFPQKLYGAKIEEDDILIQGFVPVRRVSDGAVGMFDKVNSKFYGNDGTGKFIAGPETGNSFIIDGNNAGCVLCPDNTYKPNAGNVECTKCPTGTFSPIGSTQLSDCAKILHVGEYVVYMPLGKRTEHGLCVMVDDKKYCADVYERQ